MTQHLTAEQEQELHDFIVRLLAENAPVSRHIRGIVHHPYIQQAVAHANRFDQYLED